MGPEASFRDSSIISEKSSPPHRVSSIALFAAGIAAAVWILMELTACFRDERGIGVWHFSNDTSDILVILKGF